MVVSQKELNFVLKVSSHWLILVECPYDKAESEPLIWKKSGQLVSSLQKPYTFSTLVEDKENMCSMKKKAFFYVYEAPSLKEVVIIYKTFR